MADLTYSMLFKADAAQAVAALQALKQDADQLAAGVTAAGAASAAAGTDMAAVTTAGSASATAVLAASDAHAEHASAVQMLRAAVQPMVSEFFGLQDAVRTVTQLEDAGVLTAREAAMAHDLLARQATELAGRMQAAGVSVDGTTAALRRQDTALQSQINRLTGVEAAAGQTAAEQLRYGASLDQLRAKYNPLFAASRQYELILGEIAEAERLGAISTMEAANARERAAASLVQMPGQLNQVGASSQQAASHVGNLGFQFNDIGMMLAAGQSPFMLMIQQGPQVVQVLGQMRASGMALGPAIAGTFTAMLNPMAFATLAIIGFGAAAIQWLTGAETQAVSLDDALGRLQGSVSDLREATQLLDTTDLSSLRDKYGELSAEVLNLINLQRELAVMDAMRGSREAMSAMVASFDGWVTSSLDGIRNSFDTTYDNARRIMELMEQVSAASTPEEALAAVTALRAHIEGTVGPLTSLEGAAYAMGAGLVEAESMLRQVVVEAGRAEGAMDAMAGTATGGLGQIVSGLGSAFDAMNAMVAAAPGGGWLSGAIAQASALAGQLWEGARAAAAARQAAAQGYIDSNQPGGTGYLANQYAQYGQGRAAAVAATREAAPLYNPPGMGAGVGSGAGRVSGAGAGGGGGGAAVRDERDALRELIETQEEQIAALRITDPVQKEIQKNHEALAKATEAERQVVEANIRERLRLQEVQKQIEEIGKAGERAFTGLVTGAHSFSDALSMMLNKLAEMAASSAWDILWSGGSRGGGGLGGLLGGIFNGGGLFGDGGGDLFNNIVGLADGGMVDGPGGPRDDRVLTRTSPGEYIVNAAQTARHLPLIEAINNGASVDQMMSIIGGQRPAFADGGMVGGITGSQAPASSRPAAMAASSSPSGSAGNGQVGVRIYFDSRKEDWTAHVENISGRVSAEVVKEGLGIFSDQMLPDRLAEIDSNPRVRG